MADSDCLHPLASDLLRARAEMDREAQADRRSEPRVELVGTVRYRLPRVKGATWSYGATLDLSSSGGAFLVDGAWRLVEAIESDEWVPIEFELQLPDQDQPLELRARVVWVDPDGGGAEGVDRVGVRFDDLSVSTAAKLHGLLAQMR